MGNFQHLTVGDLVIMSGKVGRVTRLNKDKSKCWTAIKFDLFEGERPAIAGVDTWSKLEKLDLKDLLLARHRLDTFIRNHLKTLSSDE